MEFVQLAFDLFHQVLAIVPQSCHLIDSQSEQVIGDVMSFCCCCIARHTKEPKDEKGITGISSTDALCQ